MVLLRCPKCNRVVVTYNPKTIHTDPITIMEFWCGCGERYKIVRDGVKRYLKDV